MRFRKAFCTVVVLLLAGMAVRVSGDERPPTTQPAAPSVELVFESKAIKPEAFVRFQLRFTNPTDAPITVVRPIDGCDAGWRFATYTWSVTDADGNAVKPQPMGRCGNVNPLRKDDFVIIPARESVLIENGFLPSPNLSMQMKTPGRYKVKATYVCDPAKPDKGGIALGKDEEGAAALRAGAWSGTITSAEVEVTVETP